MTDKEIENLRTLLKDKPEGSEIAWFDPRDGYKTIVSVSKEPVDDEPTCVAYLQYGGYIALVGVDVDEIVIIQPAFAKEATNV